MASLKNNIKPETDIGKKINDFLEKHRKWMPQLKKLRELLNSCETEEAVKWSSPAYTVQGKTIISLVAFKNHYALWFHQGVFLTDSHNVLVNAQEGVTKALRQWCFTNNDELPLEIIRVYIEEAVANQVAGKTLKPEKKTLNLQAELKEALADDRKLEQAFEQLTPGKQREYAQFIESAKLEKTRFARLEKIKPMILSGVGLNDRYRKC